MSSKLKATSSAGIRILSSLFFFLLVLANISGQEREEWKVWVKTSPCSGRFDWITVAKENPTINGLDYFEIATLIESPLNCTVTPCTFRDATRVANRLRSSDSFFKYCCRDYSVWENAQTGERTVVIGKFSTLSNPWHMLKSDLCCEEAEALSDIKGACSGHDGGEEREPCLSIPGSISVWNDISNKMECICPEGKIWNETKTACIEVYNADCSVFPGSYAAWNEVNNRYECYCPEGKMWNESMTACIEDVSKIKCWPGSHAAWNEQLQKTECYCNQGLVWNAARTACVDKNILVKETDCSTYKGSYAFWNDLTQRVECVCPNGKKWNDSFTACIDDVSKIKCWPGSYAAWNEQLQKTECYCNAGLVWNTNRTACVDKNILLGEADCSKYEGSYAAWNDQTQQVECVCPYGRKWNESFTACIDDGTKVDCWPGSHALWNEQHRKVECICNQGLVWNSTKTECVKPDVIDDDGIPKDGGKGTWSLISATAMPEKKTGWTYSPQSSTAHLDIYNGDKVNFNWTPPPSTITESGFSVTVSVSNTLGPNSRVMSSLIGVSGVGLDSDTPSNQRLARADIPSGSATATKTVKFTPNSSASEIEVEIGIMWGDLRITYKYKKN